MKILFTDNSDNQFEYLSHILCSLNYNMMMDKKYNINHQQMSPPHTLVHLVPFHEVSGIGPNIWISPVSHSNHRPAAF